VVAYVIRSRQRPKTRPAPLESGAGRVTSREAVAAVSCSRRAVEDRLLHLADGAGDPDLAGAGLGAVEDGAAAPHALAVVQPLEGAAINVSTAANPVTH
jgi:hypothetical protein